MKEKVFTKNMTFLGLGLEVPFPEIKEKPYFGEI